MSTPEWALEAIEEAREHHPSKLRLSGLGHGEKLTKIPEEVFALASLKVLELSNNALGEVPDAISRLTNLEYLNISSNDLGEVPDTITYLTSLWTNQLEDA